MRILLLLFTLTIALTPTLPAQSAAEHIRTIKEKYAPDRRVEVFDIGVRKTGDTLWLEGETTSAQALEQLRMQLSNTATTVLDSVRLLPAAQLGDHTWGVVNNSVGTLRGEPRYAAELTTQVLLGMPVRILDRKEGWRRVQTPDRYIGWMHGSIVPMTKSALQAYLKQPKVIVTALTSTCFEWPDPASQAVADLVAGDMLTVTGTEADFYAVSYPDGRKGYLPQGDAERVETWQAGIELTGDAIVRTAFRFTGIPYLWGGTSAKGLDCSGFTKSVYWLHGVVLARDASQQVCYGMLIDEAGHFDRLHPGDLVFFGDKSHAGRPRERVVHVGIYIGNKRFIHASDHIRISSFDPADPLYDAYNTDRYLRARRIIGHVGSEGIESLFEHAFYR